MGVVIAFGMLLGLGVALIITGIQQAPVRLDDALALLDRRPSRPVAPTTTLRSSGIRLPLSQKQQQLLSMQGRPVQDFLLEKLILGGAGLLLPGLWILLQALLGKPLTVLPFLISPVAAIAGFFLPDLNLLRNSAKQTRSMNEAIHTFFDLVALERLSNASAAQATASAASISQAPLFRRITVGLERARMEQVPPWEELRTVGKEWRIPELTDFADVMQMEEQGAGLASVLQSRVRELRDAHLNRVKQEAAEASEAMTLWMTIPAMLLGLAFLAPALLRLTTL